VGWVYDFGTFTIKDDERGLSVEQMAGPGPGVYAGLMKSDHWSFRFLAHRLVKTEQGLVHLSDGASSRIEDGNTYLAVRIGKVEGEWNRRQSPIELAREAALAREVQFGGADPAKVVIS
jgi:hypothetical protein